MTQSNSSYLQSSDCSSLLKTCAPVWASFSQQIYHSTSG